MVADLQIEAEEANGGVLLTVVDSARLTMLLTIIEAVKLLEGSLYVEEEEHELVQSLFIY